MIGNEISVWAEHGVVGLVLFALFSLIGAMITIFIRHLAAKDRSHSTFIRGLVEMHSETSERLARAIDENRNAHTKTSERLTGAIDRNRATQERTSERLVGALDGLTKKLDKESKD